MVKIFCIFGKYFAMLEQITGEVVTTDKWHPSKPIFKKTGKATAKQKKLMMMKAIKTNNPQTQITQ